MPLTPDEQQRLHDALEGVRIAVEEDFPRRGKVAVMENLCDVVLGHDGGYPLLHACEVKLEEALAEIEVLKAQARGKP